MADTILDRLKRVIAPFVHQILVYDADPPTIADGDMRPAQMGAKGGMLVEFAPGYSPPAAGAAASVDQGTAGSSAWLVKFTAATPSSSSAYEKGRVLKSSAGTFLSLFVELDASLATGTYYVQLLANSATLPADGLVGTLTHLRPPQRIDHTTGTASSANFYEGERGIAFSVGLSACVSSTQFAKTEVAGAALFAGSVL